MRIGAQGVEPRLNGKRRNHTVAIGVRRRRLVVIAQRLLVTLVTRAIPVVAGLR